MCPSSFEGWFVLILLPLFEGCYAVVLFLVQVDDAQPSPHSCVKLVISIVPLIFELLQVSMMVVILGLWLCNLDSLSDFGLHHQRLLSHLSCSTVPTSFVGCFRVSLRYYDDILRLN